MPWQTPKTDWDSNDYFNFDDMNRVEGNTEALADLIDTYAARPDIGTVVDNRDNTSFDFYDSLNRIEGNIEIIKNAAYEPVEWIAPKTNWISLDPFGYVDANRLEGNLQALYTLVNNIINYLQYCGTFTCGQDNTYL